MYYASDAQLTQLTLIFTLNLVTIVRHYGKYATICHAPGVSLPHLEILYPRTPN